MKESVSPVLQDVDTTTGSNVQRFYWAKHQREKMGKEAGEAGRIKYNAGLSPGEREKKIAS